MNLRPAAAFLAMAVCVLHSAGTFAQAPVVDARELDERLKRLERLFDSGALFKLVDEMDSLATEVRELRGQAEALSHRIEQMEERQRQLYLDADQRLQRLESAAPAQAAGPSLQPGALPAAPTTPTQTATPGQIPAATAPAAQTPDATGVDPFAEQQAYQSAFDLLKVRALRRSRGRFSASSSRSIRPEATPTTRSTGLERRSTSRAGSSRRCRSSSGSSRRTPPVRSSPTHC